LLSVSAHALAEFGSAWRAVAINVRNVRQNIATNATVRVFGVSDVLLIRLFVESGKKDGDRPVLAEAIQACRLYSDAGHHEAWSAVG